MSVAASLARMRATTPRARPAPSLLYDKPSSAASISRAEMAGTALNGLESLSAVDPALPSLYAPLLLTDSRRDRATLAPSEAAALSAAVVTLAKRLAPAFPLRHAQKALEWLVRGLNVPTLGSDAEIDAMLLAGLPFSATPQFAALVHALLAKGVSRPNWKWLMPVAKQRKPPSTHFILRNCPSDTLRVALSSAVDAVHAGISTVALSAFLVNVLGRRLAASTTAMEERRSLLLAVLDALGKVRKLKHMSRRKAQVEVLCSLLSCVAAATAQAIEPEVASAAAKTISLVLLKVERKTASSDSALACLALLVTRANVAVLPKEQATFLVATDTLRELLPRLKNMRLAEVTYHACVEGIIPNTAPTREELDVIAKALSLPAAPLIPLQCVTAVVVRLLQMVSPYVGSGAAIPGPSSETSDLHSQIASIIAPLARGAKAEGVDAALRKHFESRKKKQVEAGRYLSADKVLADALSGSTFERLKVSLASGKAVPNDTLEAMLSHPELTVRRAALRKVLAEEDLLKRQNASGNAKLVATLTEICRSEVDVEAAALAAQCMLLFPSSSLSMELLRVVVSRFRTGHLRHVRKKKKMRKVLDTALHALGNSIIKLCEICLDDEAADVQALLFGLMLEESLTPGAGVDVNGLVSILSKTTPGALIVGDVKTSWSTGLTETLKRSISEAVFNTDVDGMKLVHFLAKWDCAWVFAAAELRLVRRDKLSSLEEAGELTSTVDCLISMANGDVLDRQRVAELLADAAAVVCHKYTAGGIADSRAKEIWSLAVVHSKAAPVFVESMARCVGLEGVVGFLKSIILSTVDDDTTMRSGSLKWFMNLSHACSSEDVQQDLVLVLLGCLYGNDRAVRAELVNICKAKVASSKKRKRPALHGLEAMVASSMDETHMGVGILGHSNERNQFVAKVLTDCQLRHDYPLPLRYLKNQVNNLDEHLRYAVAKALSPDMIPSHALALLRSVGGCIDLANGELKQALMLLTALVESSTVSELPADDLSELLVRTAMLLNSAAIEDIADGSAEAAAEAAATSMYSHLAESTFRKPSNACVQLAIVAVGTQIFSFCSAEQAATQKGRSKLVECLLLYSEMSSAVGDCAREALDKLPFERFLIDVAPYVSCFVGEWDPAPNVKNASGEDTQEDLGAELVPRKAHAGAVSSMRRRLLSSSYSPTSHGMHVVHEVLAKLWRFVSLNLRDRTSESTHLDDEVLYGLENAMDILSLFYENVEVTLNLNDAVDIAAAVNGVFYVSPDTKSVSASIRSLRKASLRVLTSLASKDGPEVLRILQPAVEERVAVSALDAQLETIHGLIPIFLKCGLEFLRIVRWLVCAAYGKKRKVSLSEREQIVLASSCKFVDDVQAAVHTCMEEIVAHCTNYMSSRDIAKECSQMLLAVNQNAIEDATAISRSNESIRCELSLVHMLQPAFASKLSAVVDGVDPTDGFIETAFTNLYVGLLQVSEGSSRQESLCALLAILPLPTIGSCVVAGLHDSTTTAKLEGLRALLDRLEASEVLLSWTWNLDVGNFETDPKLQRAAEVKFAESVGGALRNVLKNPNNEDALASHGLSCRDLKCVALSNIDQIGRRLGSSIPAELLKFSSTVLELLEEDASRKVVSNPSSGGPQSAVVAASLTCMSTMISCLRKNAIPFIPKLLHMSTSILGAVFGSSLGEHISRSKMAMLISLAESAVRTCTAVLNGHAKFFGRNALQRITFIVVSGSVEVVDDLFVQAVLKVPAPVAILSIDFVAKKLSVCGATPKGVVKLLKGVTAIAEAMRKSELKLHTRRLVDMIVKCLRFRRIDSGNELDLPPSQTGEVNLPQANGTHCDDQNESEDNSRFVEDLSVSCKEVDVACADALTALVLRLSETEFKEVFDSLLQWMGGSSIPATVAAAAKDLSFTLSPKLLRGVPFYKLSVRLFRTLRAIYIPYFFQVLDEVLDIVACKRPPSSSVAEGDSTGVLASQAKTAARKRKFNDFEQSQAEHLRRGLGVLQVELYNTCLDNLLEFLKLDLGTNVFSAPMAAKVQESLLTAFDEDGQRLEKLQNALNALGSRIVAIGNLGESKDESRELLMSLSRAILQRTRNVKAEVRSASLDYATSLAVTVGDEILVALPETMPVLSEVVDDEDATVQRAAKAFIEVLESLAGEPILSEIS